MGDDGKSKEISTCPPNDALHLPFFNYASTFWKVVNNRTVQFKWVAGVEEAERRLEFLGGDDKPDTRPVNVTGRTAPHCIDKASKQASMQT